MVDVLYQSLLTRMGPSNEYINKWFDRLNENKIGEEIILKVPTTIAELKSLAVAFFDWLHANKDVFLKNSSLSKLANTPVTDLSEDKGHVQNANEIEENGNNRKENNVYVKRCRSSSIWLEFHIKRYTIVNSQYLVGLPCEVTPPTGLCRRRLPLFCRCVKRRAWFSPNVMRKVVIWQRPTFSGFRAALYMRSEWRYEVGEDRSPAPTL